MEDYRWFVHSHKFNRTHGFKPAKEYPIKQRDHKITEKKLKQEEKFMYKLIYDMFNTDLRLCPVRDIDIAYRYLDCVEACHKGELIDVEKAYWDLGIYEFTKMYMKN